ncbi:MAG: hypothetical protein HOO92_08105 [Methylococcaceae bacterium]|nr:hypothetical protein [Methylococcaceae bacterium]
MKVLRGILAASVFFEVSCALFPPSGSVSEQVNYWLDKQEYGKAMDVVATLQEHPDPEVSDPQTLQDKISDQSLRYEQQVIIEADKALAKEDWRSALDLYQEAMERLPTSKKLKEGQQQLEKKQQASLAKLQLDLLVSQGEAVYNELLINQQVAATNPKDWLVKYKLDSKADEAAKLANELAEYGRRGLAEGDMALAKRTLPLAAKLSSAPDIKTAYDRYRQLQDEEDVRAAEEQERIVVEEEQKQKSQRKVYEKQIKKKQKVVVARNQDLGDDLLTEFKNAYAEGRFADALQLRQKLVKLNYDNAEFQGLSGDLSNNIAKHVKHLTDIGTQHYSRQQYEQALQKWQEAQVLDPQNEQLKAHVERAAKVLEKLKNLKHKQEVEVEPAATPLK